VHFLLSILLAWATLPHLRRWLCGEDLAVPDEQVAFAAG